MTGTESEWVWETRAPRFRVTRMCGARRPARPLIRKIKKGVVLAEYLGVFWGPELVGYWRDDDSTDG